MAGSIHCKLISSGVGLATLLSLAINTGCGNQKKGVYSTDHFSEAAIEERSGVLFLNGEEVRIKKIPVQYGYEGEVPDAIRQGCEQAVKTLELATGFKIEASENPQVAIKMAPQPAKNREDNVPAITYIEYEGPWITKARVVFFNDHTFAIEPNNKEMDAESTCLHELGHAIGLGHSPDLRDVMGPQLVKGTKRRQFSRAELELIHNLYIDVARADNDGQPVAGLQ